MNDLTPELRSDFTEAAGSPHPGLLRKISYSIRQFASVSELLRLFGAAIMVASMSVFLLQGWTEGNDIQRYLKLLSQTGLLALAGLILTVLLKEYKGARMFFGLSLASVPANFTVLGALYVSLFNAGAVAGGLPAFARWVMVDGLGIGLVTVGALSVLIPVTVMGFRIMARRSAGRLALSFLALNGLLLVPVRSGMLLALVMLVATAGAWFIGQYLKKQDDTLTTPGGVFSRLLLYVPAALVIIRSLCFYHADTMLFLAASASGYFIVRQLAVHVLENRQLRFLLQVLAVPSAYSLAFFCADLIEGYAHWPLIPATMSLVLGLFMFDFRRFAGKRLSAIIESSTAIVIAGVCLPAALFSGSALAIIVAVTAGIGLSGYGYFYRSRLIVSIGALTIVLAAATGLQDIVLALFHASWIGLGVTGGAIIIFASLVDRYGANLKLRLSRRTS